MVTGTISNSYTYDTFGNLIASTGSLGNPFQYTGRDFDPETGLRYYRARYYDPQTGPFLSEDAIGFGGGIDFYSFVSNSSPNLVDPLGLTGTGTVAGPTVAEIEAAVASAAAQMARWGLLQKLKGPSVAGLAVADAVLGWELYQTIDAINGENAAYKEELRQIGLWNQAMLRKKAEKECKKDDDDGCEKEWEEARAICRDLIADISPRRLRASRRRLRGSWRGRPYNVEECARGFVSERCGGNPINWGRQGPPK
jgi:RHS repeat-associated protein